ncbi:MULTISPECIES: DUF305 domain-containing protein [unclassified Streptomyces]|uniref:DUF305 domain-containing protein n=1 Tax=unclassified Streptomyces TaxID=2593676 RepID=UPI00099B6DA9|nr:MULTISPECIES: DUF305 domain-containing protein [unclassified Streptomyces]
MTAAEAGEHEDAVPEDAPAPSRRRVWWPAALAAALALALGVPALVAGGTSASGTSSSLSVPADDSPEAGFARDMATHHQQAVDLSFIVRDRTTDEPTRTLAFDIINTQANQRGMMMGWLDQWGLTQHSPAKPMAWMAMGGHGHGADYQAHDGSLMPGMATTTQLAKLRSLSGREAEVFYLQLMLEHHKGGVEMAQGYVDMAHNESEKRLAQSMVIGQTSEIGLITDMLKDRGAAPGVPAS